MPDWQKLVEENLSLSAVPATRRAEIHAELAQHMEEAFQEAVSAGVPAEDAEKQALASVADWKQFESQILNVEARNMNPRLRTVWLPGITGFALAFYYWANTYHLALFSRDAWNNHDRLLHSSQVFLGFGWALWPVVFSVLFPYTWPTVQARRHGSA